MSKGVGLDPGRASVRLAELKIKKGGISLNRYHSMACEEGETSQEAVAAAFGHTRLTSTPVRVGLTGSDVMVRYLPVPPVEDWRLERLMDFEVREIESRSGSPLATSFNLLPVPHELDEDDTILLGLIKEDLLDDWLDAAGKLPVQGFSPNAIALYNSYLALGDHDPCVTLLANVGHGSLDLALVRGTELYFARSVSTSLEGKDALLAKGLGIGAERARGLIHQHLDLRAGLGQRLSSDAERVTRPILSLYDSLPTLLSGVITLCKAQARLRDLTLDRILLTGGAAQAQGLVELVTKRSGVSAEVWDPTSMVDASGLPEDQYEHFLADGPASAVVLGLACSVADPELYAMEILPSAAKKKRDFQERGIFSVMACVFALIFLGVEFYVNSGRAIEQTKRARELSRQAQVARDNDLKADDLGDKLVTATALFAELRTRQALQETAGQFLDVLMAWLPSNLWVEGLLMELTPADEWGMEGGPLPAISVTLRGEDRERRAADAFTEFSERVKALLPGGDAAIRIVSRDRGRNPQWTITAILLSNGPGSEEMLSEEDEA
ncbi:MAG: hypothetical protein MK213_08135 [Planctomycetes bacterium]|nr:hypothetical protein [Planctomycetota bacterium]